MPQHVLLYVAAMMSGGSQTYGHVELAACLLCQRVTDNRTCQRQGACSAAADHRSLRLLWPDVHHEYVLPARAWVPARVPSLASLHNAATTWLLAYPVVSDLEMRGCCAQERSHHTAQLLTCERMGRCSL
jgi:hypothetical protein